MLPDFPEFIPLTIELKDPYNQAISPYTPYSDISFATLQIWWNVSEKLSVSLLNGNLVIDYNLFHDEDNSGLSLVGKTNVDDAIQKLFEYLKDNQRKQKLVHIPEFVVIEIKDRSGLEIIEETDYNEYILDSSAFAALEGPEYKTLRKKIKRFHRTVENRQLEIRELDLSLGDIQDQLFKSISEWQTKNKPENDPENTEHEALTQTFSNASQLDIKNLAVYVDKELHGFMVYHRPLNKEYYVLHHLKANYELPYISDFLHHEVAKKAVSEDVKKLNIEMDLGIEKLREHKMTLRPSEVLKKYTITPVNK